MNERGKSVSPAVGGSTLLVIFAVLAMSIFALLTLNTVLSEKRLSDASIRAAADWYAADSEAEEIFARLRNGEEVSGVERLGNRFRYRCSVSETQQLYVELQEKNGVWQVLCWQTVATPAEAGEQNLAVWDGETGDNP